MKTPDRHRTGTPPSAENSLRGLYLGVSCYRRPTIGASPTTFHTVSLRTRVNRSYAGPLLVLLLQRCRAESSGSLHAGIGQVLMDQCHRHSTLSHRGGAPLDRATTRVASCEYARLARLLEERFPRAFSPGVLIERRTVQRLPRQDEAPFVEVDGPLKPAGVGISPDEGKERPDSQVPSYTRAVILDYSPL